MTTEILKINFLNDEDLYKLRKASEIIKKGGLVVFPTETVYGLGADATNAEASKKIYSAKGRPSDNPLIIHVHNPKDAEKYAYTNEVYYKLAESFMPGPLTVVLPSKSSVPTETRGGLGTVAVRCPQNVIARKLIEFSGVPIAAPSANLSGSPSPTKASHVIDDMNGRVDIIIDGGDADFGLESTIVKVERDGSLTLLRPGKITVNDLLSVVSRVEIAEAVIEELKENEVALSPGMKYRHYAPKSPLYLLEGDFEKYSSFLLEKSREKNIAVICYDEDYLKISQLYDKCFIYKFGEEKDEKTHAHRLFDILRDADKKMFDEIYAPLPSKEGVGLALYNRMIRAAAHHIIRM